MDISQEEREARNPYIQMLNEILRTWISSRKELSSISKETKTVVLFLLKMLGISFTPSNSIPFIRTWIKD